MLKLLVIAAILVAVIVGGDITYSTVVRARHQRWEATVERNASGVREGCEAFSAGPTDGSPVLLVHGYGDSPAVFADLAQHLASAGFHCRALRLPGFAEPMATYRKTSLAAWRSCVDGEIDRLGDGRPVWIVAHSTGGALAADAAVRRPARVAGMSLLAPLMEVSAKRSPVLTPQAWHIIGKTLLHHTDMVENLFAGAGSTEAVRSHPRDRFVPRAVIDALFELVHDIQGTGPSVHQPIQTIISDDDPVIDSAAAQAYTAQIAGPTEIVRFRDAGHAIPIGPRGPEAAEQVARFIRHHQTSETAK